MSTRLKGICVGAGYFSQFHLEAWSKLEHAEILAVCDASPEKAEDARSRYQIARAYSADDYAAMLDREQPDFVDIITPPSTHHALCQLALERGIHVICQKPLAPDLDGARALAELAEKASARFMVHENFRWQPWYREAKRLMEDGWLGEFYHFNMLQRLGDGWGEDAYLDRQPFFRDYPRLYLFETGIHFLDTFRFLFGEASTVYARTAQRNPVIQGEDSALLICEFATGGTAILDANRYNESGAENPRFTFGRFRLEGSRGHLEMDETGKMVTKLLGEPAVTHDYPLTRKGFAGDCVHALQAHFIESVLNDQPFESEVGDYMRSVELMELAYQSAATHQVQSVPE